ncbi:sushi domain-containing protein 5 [Pleuronectes platessa]|uniref:sushi domain-containing protein 5 n=1 Tax=Pleuronectes platessa TaxID=8262 RepID=UPI00232A521D|nr:sushi domain-containing protein 5 [Pleuronectes platessa]
MLDRWNPTAVWLLYGCLACLVISSVNVNADGRVFVLDLRNSSGPQGFRDAERACASQRARLASAEDLRHAVMECFFSTCTRGWLYGGTVGTTVCNVAGSGLNAVDVRTENATEDKAHLDAFCIKDKGVPCGDPPSFPNARLQGHPGFEMGDELLYTCVPGHVMPSGHTAFSLLCDSCGEWYGLVQICVKDGTESHIDYEDKFTDSYEEEGHHSERPEEAQGEVYEEVHGAAYPEGRESQEQQETSFGLIEHQDEHGDAEAGGESNGSKFEGEVEEKDEDRAVEDFIDTPRWEQERREVVRIDVAAATEAPVSLLSQKHMFWFPSEAFHEESQSVSTNPATQTPQRASGTQSEESKEHESQETQHPVDVDDHDHERDDHDTDDRQDGDDSRHYDQPDPDSHQDEDDHDDHLKHYIPAQHDDLDRRDRPGKHDEDHIDPNDHYDMGEHEDDRVRYSNPEYDDRDDSYDEHESYEDRKDVTDDHGVVVEEHPDDSKEHPDQHDHDDGEEHYDLEEDEGDHFPDHDEHDNDEHDSYDDHDSHEDADDGHQRVIVSIATDVRKNVTAKGAEEKATTDDTWLDGYPVVLEETEKDDATTVRPEDGERGTHATTTDKPNEVDIRRPVPYTSLPEEHESPTVDPEQGGVKDVWPGFIPTVAPSPDHIEPSDSPSYSDTLDYDTQQAAPTRSWQEDLTEHPFLDYGLAPPVHDGDVLMEEHTVNNLPSETGEREEVEGEMGEATCVGGDCPPRPPQSSSSKGATITVIIVALCALAAAVIVGVWCYRRQQQKSSMYEMNGKGQSHSRQGQQIEMQQKV